MAFIGSYPIPSLLKAVEEVSFSRSASHFKRPGEITRAGSSRCVAEIEVQKNPGLERSFS
jgi:hypothetical protein